MRVTVVALALALVLGGVITTPLHAQGGSNYSSLGIGDLRPWVGAQYDALSGTQIGMPTPYGINMVNPSLMGLCPTTRIQASYRFNQHINQAPSVNLAQNNGNFDGVVAMFSVDTAKGFAFSLAITPFSRVAYMVQRSLSTEVDGTTITGSSLQQGEGGTSQAQFAASVKLLPTLRVGLGIGAMFGLLSYTDNVSANGDYSKVYSKLTNDVRGLLYRAGAYWEPSSTLGVGAFATAGGDGSSYITRRAVGSASGSVYLDTTTITETTTQLPMQYGVGASGRIGSGRLGADVMMSDYTGMTINPRPDAAYTTGLRASVGYAAFGSQHPNAEYADRIGWYLGACYEKLYVTYKGANIYEYSGSTGISFPLGGNAMVDAAVSLGIRQPQADGAMQELFGRLFVSVSIGEIWFKPFARD
ncbi:MAG: hypothetical protein J5I53_06745 [Bradyrhizobiaceae bacterium]|nr:hypothetical protein [Bradyrhizobiaceae bacterium]